ncbi:MAG: bifunctional phosphoglucose/phosphomannose isomerase [Saprospiraceae bacterium]|nr:bifunctional phosphoglucose/phosphomannose isomerase [Saprospiraceae bacterium]
MIEQFPDTLVSGIRIAQDFNALFNKDNIENIYVSGMGGSGIGAEFVYSFVKDELKIPFAVGKSYDLPAWVNQNTLLILSSYSGNTEETIEVLKKGIHQSAKVVVISSGGTMMRLAIENNLSFVKLPSDWSSPRACLGFSIAAQLGVLFKIGLISEKKWAELLECADFIKTESSQIQEKSKKLAESLFGKMIVIYSSERIEPVALRFRQQINENAKRLCWHHVVPEMNHNELVGWRKSDDELAVLFLLNSDDSDRISQRMDLTKDVVSHFAGSVISLFSKGKNTIERSLYLVHLLDYASVHLAFLNGVDPVEVKVIDFLKSELAAAKD